MGGAVRCQAGLGRRCTRASSSEVRALLGTRTGQRHGLGRSEDSPSPGAVSSSGEPGGASMVRRRPAVIGRTGGRGATAPGSWLCFEVGVDCICSRVDMGSERRPGRR